MGWASFYQLLCGAWRTAMRDVMHRRFMVAMNPMLFMTQANVGLFCSLFGGNSSVIILDSRALPGGRLPAP